MPRYKMNIEYLGTNYCGWQKQPNVPTVEGEIERALGQILQQPVDIIGQGRTDAGVHAEGQVAHFDYPDAIDHSRLLYALLGVLLRDIAVYNLENVSADFHARFDAVSRRYRYQIARRPKPLLRSTSQMVLDDLDIPKMCECAGALLGIHDFSSFTKPDNPNPNSKCRITHSEFVETEELLIYSIEADRFLRHMVRRLVGTMLKVGKNKRSKADFLDLVESPHKDKNAHGASAKGLILEKVNYK